MNSFFFVFLMLLLGCASNTGVVPFGQNGFKIYKRGATGFSGSDAVKSDVMLQASEFCARSGKTVFVTNEILGSPPYIFGNFPKAEIQFKCLNENELVALSKAAKAPPTISEVKKTSESDVYSELRQLKELLNEGIINQCEFEAREKKVLAK